jgi:putative heme-binding domain-containing protein
MVFVAILVFSCLPENSPAAEPSPRVVAAWPAGLMEVRVAFDRPVDPALARSVVGSTSSFVDRLAEGRPGGNRGVLRVAGARLEPEGRTLVLATDPHPRETTYLLALPDVRGAGQSGPGSRVELSYDLSGVEVSWSEAAGKAPRWTGWWPGLDPAMAREQLAGSSGHAALWPLLEQPGVLTLRSLASLPAGVATVSVDAAAPFELTVGSESAKSERSAGGTDRAMVKVESVGDAVELVVGMTTGAKATPRVRASWSTDREPRDRPLDRTRLILPWAPANPTSGPAAAVPAIFLQGGDPKRGEVVFFGETAKCANCHAMRGKGGAVGPDLTSLAGADRAWVYRNILEPSATIHPEYASFTVAFKDGRIAMGVVRAEGLDSLRVGDIDARQTSYKKAEIEEIRPSASSIMPVGLLGALGDERTLDLLAYLTAPR